MPLTDADRMQMTLMAVMRHNVVQVTSQPAEENPFVVVIVDPVIVTAIDNFEVIAVSGIEDIEDYILT